MKYQKHLGRSIALTSALLLCPACQSTTTSEVGVRDNEVLETQQEQTLTPSSEEASIPSFEPTAVGPLHARVASTRWAERKLAQRALLQIKGEQRASSAVDFATRSLQATDPKSLQRSLLAAIALDPEMTVASVVGVLESISPDARDAALRVLVTNPQVNLQPERDALLATATSMVEDPASPASFEVGLAVLAKLADPSATQRISDAIQARDKPTRKSAMAVLQRWAVPGGLDLAIDALNAPEVYVRRRAAAALAMYPSSPVALETLASLIRTETNTRVCTRGLEALAAFPAAQVEPLLVERLSATEGCSTEHTFVTLSVARRVLRRSSVELPALRQAIMTFAAGPSLFGVKAAAIVALGDIEMAKTLTGIDAIDAFGELTSKSLESAEVRKAAIAALGAMNTQEATSRLYRVLEDVELSPGIVAATLVAIEGSGHADQERMTALIPFTAEEEAPELRTLAVSHLARHANDVTSAKRLLALRGDRDPIIMDAANRGVQRVFQGADLRTPEAITAQLELVDVRHRELQGAEVARAALVLADAHRAHGDATMMMPGHEDEAAGLPSEPLRELAADPQPPVGAPPVAPAPVDLQP